MDEQKNVLAVTRTMAIFEALAQHEELGITEIAKITSIHKSTVFRFVNTLLKLGYLSKDKKTETYRLAAKMNRFHRYSERQAVLINYGIIAMEELSAISGETIHLAKLENKEIIYLHKIESTHSLRVCTMISEIGRYAPLYCTGLGKAMLAWLSPEQQQDYINSTEFKPYTPNTIINGLALLKELEKIKKRGVSYDKQENEKGVFCIAAPIFSNKNQVVAAISLSGPTVRLEEEIIEKYSILVKKKAQEITNHLRISY